MPVCSPISLFSHGESQITLCVSSGFVAFFVGCFLCIFFLLFSGFRTVGLKNIYQYTCIKMIFWSRTSSKTFYCYSEFHASYETIIIINPHQLPYDCLIRGMKLGVAIKCFGTSPTPENHVYTPLWSYH